MRAVTCTNGVLEPAELPAPRPEGGQIRLDVLRAGICGSDLHARHHADELAEVGAASGYRDLMRSAETVVLGHEFSGAVAEYGPGTRRRWRPGTPVVAMPIRTRAGKPHLTGLSAQAPGAFAEQVVVEESLTFPVPNGLTPDIAALTEPMAVATHAVNRASVSRRDTAVVIGCGPIGLAVVAMLAAQRVERIVAVDFSPARRALAARMGAHRVVDPAVDSPYAELAGRGFVADSPQLWRLAVEGMRSLRRTPIPWEPLWRAADLFGLVTPKAPVFFECVGVPGIIDDVIAHAPLSARVVVVGVCMEADRFRPAVAINKEVDLRFSMGYTPIEFRDTLHLLADGELDPSPLITGTVGLDRVEEAFAMLGDAETHAKILIDPVRPGLRAVPD
ncbi:zinc-binding dehydrogenase [Nocardia sp. SSK8]|uniref:zinc-binding dehydrogenase n=1 Tax=Nocardia sp. SSK8 TaxID=3120154 RepID=UPI00300BA360